MVALYPSADLLLEELPFINLFLETIFLRMAEHVQQGSRALSPALIYAVKRAHVLLLLKSKFITGPCSRSALHSTWR